MRKSVKQKQRKVEKINETQRWFFDKSNKVDKLLARLNKKEREDTNYQYQT